MIAETLQGGLRHGVDRIRADELLDVKDVAVRRVLGACAGPQKALRPGALGGQLAPAVRSAELLVVGVGQLGVGNGHLAQQGAQGHSLAGAAAPLLQQGIDPAVDHAVDPADEETGDAGHVPELTAARSQLFETGRVGLGHGHVVLLGEQQGDVDVDALADELFDGGQTRRRARHLDHQVAPTHLAGQAQGFLDRGGRVVGQVRRHLQGYEPVAAVRLLVHGHEDIRRPLYILYGYGLVDLQRSPPGGGQLTQCAGVLGGPGDGLLENGRVRRHAADPVLGDQTLHLAGHDQAAADVVVPHTLAVLLQFDEGVGHGGLLGFAIGRVRASCY